MYAILSFSLIFAQALPTGREVLAQVNSIIEGLLFLYFNFL
jgi:hypothetical protein